MRRFALGLDLAMLGAGEELCSPWGAQQETHGKGLMWFLLDTLAQVTRTKSSVLGGQTEKQLPTQPRTRPGSASGAALCTHASERVRVIRKRALAEPLCQDLAKTALSKDALLDGNI